MRKIVLSALLATVTLTTFAQTMYDALDFSAQNYYGTARSIGLGNAVTALGGDLGTIGINPAGSAVASYSQFTITPALNMSVTNSDFDISGSSPYLTKDERTRVNMPNMGLMCTLDTYRTRGLKSYTFGMVVNSTNVYTDRASASNINNARSSFAGVLAAGTEAFARDYGYTFEAFNSDDSYYDSNIPWNYLIGYQSGMTSDFGDGYSYIGSTEQASDNGDGTYDTYTAGQLEQSYLRRVSGSKYDIVVNYGMNFSDKLYLGVNLGIPGSNYTFYEQFDERAVNPSDFTFTYDDGTQMTYLGDQYRYAYRADMSGIYAKIGAIWLPAPWLRIGAAVQTPTLLYVTEKFQISGTTDFNDGRVTASSPENEYTYDLRSPYRASFGAAATFGRVGLVSVDYEMCDYSTMRFREHEGYYEFSSSNVFADTNKDINSYCGIQHMLRVGGEFRPTPSFAFRAGYSLTTSPEKFVDYYTHGVSAGFGYYSNNSFFLDFATRLTNYPSVGYYPYESGVFGESNTPFITMTRSLVDAVLTLGWRF